MNNNKHFIKIDTNNFVVKYFSDAFEQPLETDICINEEGGRHFEINGTINPVVTDEYGRHNYKYENGTVTEIADADKPSLPIPLPTQEERIEALETALLEVILNG